MRTKAVFLLCLSLIGWVLFWPSTTTTPRPDPPAGAANVYFYEYNAWQTWDYEYRFDAPVEVCEAFAMELMKRQSLRKDGVKITKAEFTKFPVRSRFQPWFDVASVKNGSLISGDDWIYAVVDRDRGRLYYFNSH